tara:strand:- start:473 stop:1054 length:582 start_codon:yes stop_codon:yes gene_type:complete
MPYKQIYVESDAEDSDETIEPEQQPEINNEPEEEKVLIPLNKKKKGRPPKPLEEKLAKKTIIKHKVIYMVPDDKGGYTEQKNKQLTARDLKKIEERKKVEELEKELGKKLLTKKNGKVDKRSIGEKTRTPAQIAATKAMLEANVKRRAAQKELKDLKKENKTKETVKEALTEIIYKPSKKPQPKPSPYDNLKF